MSVWAKETLNWNAGFFPHRIIVSTLLKILILSLPLDLGNGLLRAFIIKKKKKRTKKGELTLPKNKKNPARVILRDGQLAPWHQEKEVELSELIYKTAL